MAVAKADTCRITYSGNDLYVHTAGVSLEYSTYEYKSILDSTGSLLLIRGDELELRHLPADDRVRLAKGMFQYAEFLADDRYILAQRTDGTVLILDLEGTIYAQYAFPGADYGRIRRMNDDCFAISHGESEQLCWIDWDYE